MIKAARVVNGFVVNIEIVEDGWIIDNEDINGVIYVPYTDAKPAYMGDSWTLAGGFVRPDPLTSTSAPTAEDYTTQPEPVIEAP